MHESIDWPVKTQTSRPRRHTFLFLIGALAVILFSSRTALSYWVDLLWFRSLGYGDVFWKTRALEWGIFAAFAAVTFLVLFGAFSALKRAHIADMPTTHTIFIAGNPVSLPVESALRLDRDSCVSLLISLATAAAMQAQWPTSGALLVCAAHDRRTSPTRSSACRSTSISSPCPPGISSSAGCSRWPFSVAFLPSCSFSSRAEPARLAGA